MSFIQLVIFIAYYFIHYLLDGRRQKAEQFLSRLGMETLA